MALRSFVNKNLMLVPGWRTNRKIVVFESDDWGTVRIPDTTVFNKLAQKNPALESDHISRYDCIESNDDLTALFEVLSSVKDSRGNNAVITADTIVANPDFEKIAAAGFKKYFYEAFPISLSRYAGRDKVMELIAEGRKAGLYHPQFHGREHVNVNQWLHALQKANPDLSEAFAQHVFSIPYREGDKKRKNVVSAFDFEKETEIEMHEKIITDGMNLFEKIFGFASKSFIATTYVWHPRIEEYLKNCGVKYIQGIPYQYVPNPGGEWYKKKFHYTGQKNKQDQLYIVRNAFFEPSLIKNTDAVSDCLKRVALAFKWNKPAVISTHRVNFIGSLVEKNRTQNLAKFKKVLSGIISKWPDVEFMTSDQLGDLIKAGKQ
ncbi:MAG: hypothetical protein QM791_20930 [Ferruginibacter sp.]